MKRLLSHAGLWLVLLNVGGFAQAQSKGPWLHLEVKENKTEPVLVKVNLPVSLVDVALNIIKDEKLHEGRIRLKHSEISVADMKRIWAELKNAGNAEFVTVEKSHETVRISREGNFVLVKVTEDQENKVDLKIPVSVVDALLEGPGDELNLKAAVAAMQEKQIGDILTVKANNTQVRLWID